MEESEVPDHSKSPRSRDTPNVISVGTGKMPISFKKAMKFAVNRKSVADLDSDSGYLRYVALFITINPVSTLTVLSPFLKETVFVWPPSRSSASYRWISWLVRLRVHNAAIPEHPLPTMATLFLSCNIKKVANEMYSINGSTFYKDHRD